MGRDVCGCPVPRGGDRDHRAVAPGVDVVGGDDRVDGRDLVSVGRVLRFIAVEQLVELRIDVARDLEPIVMSAVSVPASEAAERFDCFGGSCAVLVQGSGPAGSAPQAVVLARRRLLEWHAQFSRFEPASELSALNRDPGETVAVSAMMARFVEAAVYAAVITGGLVDPTLVGEIEEAGYAEDFAGHAEDFAAAAIAPPDLFRRASAPRPAMPHPAARWRQVAVDLRHSTVTRPPGIRLDTGGIAKGLFGDVLAGVLSWHRSFAVEAAGDVRLGGSAGLTRAVQITSPFHPAAILHSFELTEGAVATSGTTKRCWIDARGRPAHHLLDPATGEPVRTGIVQATALAPSGVKAEALAKAALLSGPIAAPEWLPHGGVLVYEDGAHDVIEPPASELIRSATEPSDRVA